MTLPTGTGPYYGSNFDTHLVRNNRTGRITEVPQVISDQLVATGDYQPVQVVIKHGNVPPLSEVRPVPGHYVLEVPGYDLISVPPDGDYYWQDAHLPCSEYAMWYQRKQGRSWTDPAQMKSAYEQWLKDYIAGEAEWSDMPIPQGGTIPPRPGA